MTQQPILIAGPCMAESYQIMRDVAVTLRQTAQELGLDYVFKASFDKANRTALHSPRGPGLATARDWFRRLKDELGVPILTDLHTPDQAEQLDGWVDVLQIPAFLCRQTDLITAAAKHAPTVNIKKGQFVAASAMNEAYTKVRDTTPDTEVWYTERGTFFGYGDLVVDFRNLQLLHRLPGRVIFDVTHSTQSPGKGAGGSVTGAQRSVAPLLARAAVATGYCDGIFMEVHPDPSRALSDAAAQLTPNQAGALLRSLAPLWNNRRHPVELDSSFA